ncbi:MAG TPA: hypothetical protein VGQ31_10570 [Candidatus Limnocylindrales bacterium]|nr:hypothetical protein [Candidatus Limnocylindrales bacterium]
MSFIQRAREAAEAAAEQARARATEAAGVVSNTAQDPATQEKLGQQARVAMGAARRGVSTVVERIDPGVLADLIIKATALQEMTNSSLREKRSPYRINEISIAASIPPGVTFAIGRIDIQEEAATGTEVSSADLVEEQTPGDAVIALDGTTLTQEQLAEVRNAMANDVPEDISRL